MHTITKTNKIIQSNINKITNPVNIQYTTTHPNQPEPNALNPIARPNANAAAHHKKQMAGANPTAIRLEQSVPNEHTNHRASN